MPTYECDYCNYSTIIKTHYNKHLKTDKHLNKLKELDAKLLEKFSNPKNEHKMNINEHKMSTNQHKMNINEHKMNTNELSCRYCNKFFNTVPSKRRHELHYCKIKKENDDSNKELKLIIENQKIELEIQKKETDFYKNEIENLQKRIANSK